MRHPWPGVEIEPVVCHMETFPGVAGEASGQRRQSKLIVGFFLLLWQDEGPVKVDGAGRRGGVFYHGGPELQPERLKHNR